MDQGCFGTRAIRNGGEERLSGRFRLARKRLDLDMGTELAVAQVRKRPSLS